MISSLHGGAKQSQSLQVGESEAERKVTVQLLTCLSDLHSFITNEEEGGAGRAGRKLLGGGYNGIISFATSRWNCISFFNLDVGNIFNLKAAIRPAELELQLHLHGIRLTF